MVPEEARMSDFELNIAEAKARLSELVDQVSSKRKTVTIKRRGKPMALLVPLPAESAEGLARAVGWLEDDDPFFAVIEEVVAARRSDPDRGRARTRRR
jgi:prevent-host-death family protein